MERETRKRFKTTFYEEQQTPIKMEKYNVKAWEPEFNNNLCNQMALRVLGNPEQNQHMVGHAKKVMQCDMIAMEIFKKFIQSLKQ